MTNPCDGSIWRHVMYRPGPKSVPFPVTDPVHLHLDGTWWFVEETWADENGPYDTEEQANQMLRYYCEAVLGGKGQTGSEWAPFLAGNATWFRTC